MNNVLATFKPGLCYTYMTKKMYCTTPWCKKTGVKSSLTCYKQSTVEHLSGKHTSGPRGNRARREYCVKSLTHRLPVHLTNVRWEGNSLCITRLACLPIFYAISELPFLLYSPCPISAFQMLAYFRYTYSMLTGLRCGTSNEKWHFGFTNKFRQLLRDATRS